MNIRRIPIATIGVIRLDLPVVTVGRGQPVVSIITGLHGGEESGLLIVRDLLRALRSRIPGTLRIFPAGNPLTQAFKQRSSPLDNINPNRAFPGSDEGVVSGRIAALTLKAMAGSDLVIDLHCFGQDSVFTGVLVSNGDPALVAVERAYMRLLKPSVVWVEATATPDGVSTTKNLGGYLNSVGVPNFAVEMPRADHLPLAMRRAVVTGLMRVIRRAGRVTSRTAISTTLLEISRLDVRCQKSGFFLPKLKPLSPLSRGTPVGQLVDPVTFRETVVRSPAPGRLFLITRPSLVRSGDKLFTVGRPVPSK